MPEKRKQETFKSLKFKWCLIIYCRDKMTFSRNEIDREGNNQEPIQLFHTSHQRHQRERKSRSAFVSLEANPVYLSMAFAVLSHILCKVSDDSVREQKHLIWLCKGGSRITYEGAGGSIWSNVRTYPTYLERQAWANCEDPDQTPENAASDLGPHCLPLILQFYTVLLADCQVDLKISIRWK